VEYLAQRRPLLSWQSIGHLGLHGVHDLPPTLGLGVRCHLAHVGCVVCAVVLEVGEQDTVAQKDAVVADAAVGNSFKDTWPHIGVVTDVLCFVFGAELNDLSVTLQ